MSQKDLNMTNGAPIWSPVNYFVNVRMVVRLQLMKYAVDFKQMVVDEHINGLSKEAVAAKYHVAPSSVALWTREYRTNNQPSVSREEYLEQQELNRLRIDNQIFAECRCTRFASVSERIDEVLRLKGKYNIHALCRVLDINRSAVYHRDRRAPEKHW